MRETYNVHDVLHRLNKVRARGDGNWLACCPAHDDRNPSLSIRETDDIPLLYCFSGGCTWRDVLAAIGMQAADFFPDNPTAHDGKRTRRSRMDGWTAVGVLRHRLTMVALGCSALAAGKLTDEERAELYEAANDLCRILGEAHEIR